LGIKLFRGRNHQIVLNGNHTFIQSIIYTLYTYFNTLNIE
jgi:hypothetical protein